MFHLIFQEYLQLVDKVQLLQDTHEQGAQFSPCKKGLDVKSLVENYKIGLCKTGKDFL